MQQTLDATLLASVEILVRAVLESVQGTTRDV